MKPDAATEEKGMAAYESARAFEALRRRRLPLIYGLAVMIFVLCGVVLLGLNQMKLGLFFLVAAGWFAFTAWNNWRLLSRRYAENLALLAKLEAEFGNELPWKKVELHLAEVRALQQSRPPVE